MGQLFVLPKADREALCQRIYAFLMVTLPNRHVSVEVKEHRTKRSDAQNKYLWGVCYATLQKATGQEANDWHEYMLGEWAGWEIVELFGQQKRRPVRRSSKLDTVDFMEFVMFIQQRAAQYGIYIPDPDPSQSKEWPDETT